MTIKTYLYGLAAASALMFATPAFADEDTVEEPVVEETESEQTERRFDGSAHLGGAIKSKNTAFGLIVSDGPVVQGDAALGYGPFHLGTSVVYDFNSNKVSEVDVVGGVGGQAGPVNMDLSVIYASLPGNLEMPAVVELLGKVSIDDPLNFSISAAWDFDQGILAMSTMGPGPIQLGEIKYELSFTAGVNYGNIIPDRKTNIHIIKNHQIIFPVSEDFFVILEAGMIIGQDYNQEYYDQTYLNLSFSLDL